ncbi:uncharacterized protein SAPINGB_P004013 [Magnusiomyces paraingens]|uniref:Chromatin modification-related protein EAF6 n=1 Tax=Magnusiomyces paraingens TaxID=2606893 RepID=A0A5E8BSC0_9ASCO|nr:uncharacterized protein SAPINGB_P004013 [Saprochaete ingens]VVT54313.1 unnamed protein product [Saprochaete ingens]
MPAYTEQPTTHEVNVEEYDKVRSKLRELITKKRALDKNLNALEEQIYKAEGVYLEDTTAGNVVKGFDNYIKGSQTKKKAGLNEQDRIFSMSSAIFIKVKMKEDDDKN